MHTMTIPSGQGRELPRVLRVRPTWHRLRYSEQASGLGIVLTLKRQKSTGRVMRPRRKHWRLYSSASCVASGLAAFAGLVGGGVGEQGVAAGFPAGSGVGEGADDQDGFVVGVVGGADGSVFGSGVLAAPVA